MQYIFNPDMEWTEAQFTFEGNTVEVVFMPDGKNCIDISDKAIQYFESLDLEQLVKEAREYAVAELTKEHEEAEKLIDMPLEGMTIYKNKSIDLFFNDYDIFGGHTVVVSRNKNGFIECGLEG